jgi:hypothetical protein
LNMRKGGGGEHVERAGVNKRRKRLRVKGRETHSDEMLR